MDVTVLFDCHVEYETEGDVEGAIQQNFLFLSCFLTPSVSACAFCFSCQTFVIFFLNYHHPDP